MDCHKHTSLRETADSWDTDWLARAHLEVFYKHAVPTGPNAHALVRQVELHSHRQSKLTTAISEHQHPCFICSHRLHKKPMLSATVHQQCMHEVSFFPSGKLRPETKFDMRIKPVL